jgi:hypothetical protein
LEVGGWRLEVGGWRLEVGGWRLEVGGWKMVCHLDKLTHHNNRKIGPPDQRHLFITR